MKKLTLSALFTTFALAMTSAHAYQFEAGANVNYVDPKHGETGSSFGVDGTYYFKNIPSQSAALAESAFLSKTSNVKANAQWADNGNVDTSHYGVGVEYFHQNSPFYASADVARHNVETKTANGKFDYDTTTFGAELGYFPTKDLLIAVGARGYDNSSDSGIDPTIRAKYLTDLAGKKVNLEAAAAFGNLDEYRLQADYYLDPTFSVGADFYNNDLSTEKTFGINAKKFISPELSIGGRVGFTDVANQDAKTFGVEAKYRF